MIDHPDDDSDAWYDWLSESVAEPEGGPRLPEPDALPRSGSWPRPSWRTVILVLVAALAICLALVGRADVWMMRLGAIALVVGLMPRILGRRLGIPLSADATTRFSGEAAAWAAKGRDWKRSAWVFGALVLAAGLATIYTHDAYSTSVTPDLREIPLRWAGLVACFSVATGLLFAEERRCERARREVYALIEELEFDGASESVRSSLGPSLLMGLFAVVAAIAAPRMLAPENLDDSPGRILVIGSRAGNQAQWLRSRFGFDAEGKTIDEAWSSAQERFGGQRGQLETLTHLADLEGFGFVVIELDAFPIELTERADVELMSPMTPEPTVAVLATGDTSVLEHYVWSGVGRTRTEWLPLGPHAASLGEAEPWMEGDAAVRLAVVRALFAQPAFHQLEEPSQLTSRNYTLIRGIVYFDLPPTFWVDAIDTYLDIEAAVEQRRIPSGLGFEPQ